MEVLGVSTGGGGGCGSFGRCVGLGLRLGGRAGIETRDKQT